MYTHLYTYTYTVRRVVVCVCVIHGLQNAGLCSLSLCVYTFTLHQWQDSEGESNLLFGKGHLHDSIEDKRVNEVGNNWGKLYVDERALLLYFYLFIYLVFFSFEVRVIKGEEEEVDNDNPPPSVKMCIQACFGHLSQSNKSFINTNFWTCDSK